MVVEQYYFKMCHVSLVNATRIVGKCQDNCGIRTGSDPLFSLINEKRKKQYGLTKLFYKTLLVDEIHND